eukprot:356139-Chlamydomonas_euryale.AAC.11
MSRACAVRACAAYRRVLARCNEHVFAVEQGGGGAQTRQACTYLLACRVLGYVCIASPLYISSSPALITGSKRAS